MNNQGFLKAIAEAFEAYLTTGSRSNEKLKVLHGAIASDLSAKLGPQYYLQSLGHRSGKEGTMEGRYIDKVVDRTISKPAKQLAGVAVKYVMDNYSQNSNNYFEGMLGETANIRTAGKAYFQIIVLPELLPYFNDEKVLTRWERITDHNLHKYIVLSKDNVSDFMHTPQKTLIYLIHLSDCPSSIKNKKDYLSYYSNMCARKCLTVTPSTSKFAFSDNVILNDYETYIDKITHYIKSL